MDQVIFIGRVSFLHFYVVVYMFILAEIITVTSSGELWESIKICFTCTDYETKLQMTTHFATCYIK